MPHFIGTRGIGVVDAHEDDRLRAIVADEADERVVVRVGQPGVDFGSQIWAVPVFPPTT